MTPSAPRSPVRLRLYVWVAGSLLGGLEGALAVTVADAAARCAACGETGLGGGPGDGVADGGVLGAGTGTHAVLVAVALCAAVVAGTLCGPAVSRALGRRTAGLVADVLVAAGALLAVPLSRWAALEGLGGLTGLGGLCAVGTGAGLLLVTAPQVCHELSLRGHRRLMPQAMALVPAGAALDVLGSWWLPQPVTGAWVGVLVLGVVHLGVSLSLPESPVWLVGRGRDVRAFEALRRLHGNLEAAVAVDWARHEADMDREQQRLTAAELRVPQIRQATVTSVVLVVAQEAPLGAAALVLAPAVAGGLGAGGDGTGAGVAGGGAAVAVVCVGWVAVSLMALVLGRVEVLERLRFLRVVLGTVVAVVSATLLVAALATAGGGGLPEGTSSGGGLSGGALAGTVVGCLLALVGGQYVLVLPACQGAVDPRIPPWLVATQRRLVAVGQALARAGAIVGPLLVYHHWGLEALSWVLFTLTVVATAVVLVRMPRALRGG